jgi:hypothetical protein
MLKQFFIDVQVRVRELKFPLIAGTSLTLTWRRPALELDLETPVKRAVGYFYGGKEAYGYHGVEVFQSMVERRKGGETGIQWVQCVEGTDVWKWSEANHWARNLLEEAMRYDDTLKRGRLEENVKAPILFLLGYRSGLQGVVYLLTGQTEQAGFAAEIEGRTEPAVCCFLTHKGGHGAMATVSAIGWSRRLCKATSFILRSGLCWQLAPLKR